MRLIYAESTPLTTRIDITTFDTYLQYVDKDGSSHNPIMGCYGIGVVRLAASICKAKHDDYKPIWQFQLLLGKFTFVVFVPTIKKQRK